MIRLLTIQDLPLAAQLGPQFYAEGKLPGRFVPEVFARNWTDWIESGVGFILGLFEGSRLHGCFGSLIAPDPNDGTLVSSEMFWFVHPECRGGGLRLINAYEPEARRRGAKRFMMIHLLGLQPEALSRLYKKRGYVPIETTYLKEA